MGPRLGRFQLELISLYCCFFKHKFPLKACKPVKFFVKLGNSKNIMAALYKGFIVTAISSLAILYPITDYVLGLEKSKTISDKTFTGMSLYICGNIGLAITGLIIWVKQ